MSTTPVLAFEEMAAQAEGVPTFNKGVRRAEQIIGANALDRDLTSPPGSPSEGHLYIVGPSATGDWAGKDGQLAYYSGGAWLFISPKTGMEVYIVDEGTRARWNGSVWVALEGLKVLTDGATIAWDVHLGRYCHVVIAGNRTLSLPTHLIKGYVYVLTIRQDATGSRTITWPSEVQWAGGSAVTLSTAANAMDLFQFLWTGAKLVHVSHQLAVA